MNTLTDLGLAVAALRKERKMTQKQLASLSGLGQSTLARFETGGVPEFGARKLLRLLEVLGHEMSFTPGRQVFTLDDALAERHSEAAVAPVAPSKRSPGDRRSAH
jgi:HTH-type transcriptional regulator/antitoxin HipB